MKVFAQGGPFDVFPHVRFYIRDMAQTGSFLRSFGIELEEYKDHGAFAAGYFHQHRETARSGTCTPISPVLIRHMRG
jgi:hypothetical protein